MLTLDEICEILGCSKPVASRLRNGKYERGQSELMVRYQALAQMAARVRASVDRAEVVRQLCVECPREDCTGCRLMEL